MRRRGRLWEEFRAVTPICTLMGEPQALHAFDRLYRQDSGESALQQLQVQLANALPYDLEETELSEHGNLNPRWHDWQAAKAAC